MVGGDPADDASIPGVVHHLTKPGTAGPAPLAGPLPDRPLLHRAGGHARLPAAARRGARAGGARSGRPIEVYDTIRLGQHAPAAPRARRRVLYLDDLFSVRYDRMLNFAADNGDGHLRPARRVRRERAPVRPAADPPAGRSTGPILRQERDRIRQREDAAVRRLRREPAGQRGRGGAAAGGGPGSTSVELIHDMLPAAAGAEAQPGAARRSWCSSASSTCRTTTTRSARSCARRCPGWSGAAPARCCGSSAAEPATSCATLAAAHPDSVRLEGFVPDLDAGVQPGHRGAGADADGQRDQAQDARRVRPRGAGAGHQRGRGRHPGGPRRLGRLPDLRRPVARGPS